MNIDRIDYITLKALQADSNTLSKTKWNKIIFFVDLAFYTSDNPLFKNNIYTGLDYIKMPYGPVVDNFNIIISNVAFRNNLQVKSYFGLYSNQSQYIEPTTSLVINKDYPKDEAMIINQVIKKIAKSTATQLSEYSHKLTIWKIPSMYEKLNFEYSSYDRFKINDDFIGSFYEMIMK